MRSSSAPVGGSDGARLKTRPVKPPTTLKNEPASSTATKKRENQRKIGVKRKIENTDEESTNKNKQGNVNIQNENKNKNIQGIGYNPNENITNQGYAYNLDVSNSFKPLEMVSEDNASEFYSDLDTVSNASTIPKKKRATRVPPIIMNGHIGNPKGFYQYINTIIKGPIKIKCTRTKTIFNCESVGDHAILIKYFKETNLEFYTYPLPGQGLVKTVMRGLSRGFTAEDVAVELKEKGFSPHKVIQMKEKDTGKPIPLFICLFPSETPIQSVFKIERLCYMTVKWERYKNKSKVTQCYRCLGFNHTSRTCCFKERCIKCGENHENKECVKEEPRCANCTGAHLANSPQCPILIREAEKRLKAKTVQANRAPPPCINEENFPNLHKKGGKIATHPPAPAAWVRKEEQKEDSKGILNELIDLVKHPGILELLGKIIKLIKSLTLAKDGPQRLQILMEEGVSILNSWP